MPLKAEPASLKWPERKRFPEAFQVDFSEGVQFLHYIHSGNITQVGMTPVSAIYYLCGSKKRQLLPKPRLPINPLAVLTDPHWDGY